MGEGISPVPVKLAERIWQGKYVEMGELLPEFWLGLKDEVVRKARPRRTRNAEFHVICGVTGSSGTRADTGADGICKNISAIRLQLRAKKNVPNKRGDIGMEIYYLCQPNTYVIAREFGEQQ